MNGCRPYILSITVILAGCVANQPAPLIESLDTRDYRIEQRKPPEISRSQVVKKYREFLDYATGEPMYGNAIRRLADIELETAEQETLTDKSEVQTEITRRKMEAAIRMYTAYLKAYPHRKNVDLILYQLAKAYDLTGDYLGTLNTLTRLVNNHPDSRHYIEAQFRRGEMLFALRQYDKSEKAYQKIISQAENSVFSEKAMFKYGWALFKQNKHIPALHAFFNILDAKRELGFIQRAGFAGNLVRTEKELLDDTLRVVSLSFSYLDGAKGIQQYFSRYGARPYEPLIYKRLAATYLKKERFKDAADTYLAFGQHYPASDLAPEFHQQAIEVYKAAKLPTLQLATKVSFVKRYSVFGQYWKSHNHSIQEKIKPLLQAHLQDLAQHHHAVARRLKNSKTKTQHYTKAVKWYKTYITSFPNDKTTANVNFLLAEAYNDTGQYHKAITEFEKTAYRYPVHKKSAEAGYAALVDYARLLKRNTGKNHLRPALINKNIDSALNFSAAFPNDRRTATVLTNTSEQLFKIKDYSRAVTTAQAVITSPSHTEKQIIIANTVIAHSQFELHNYAAAEQAYQQTLALLPKKSTQRKELQEKLAASIYKQGEKNKHAGRLALAAEHFMRLGVVVPFAAIRATAEYDAATIYIRQQNWRQAEETLLKFRRRYPRNKKYRLGIAEKLALVYTKTNEPLKAADELVRLAGSPGKTPAYKQDMLWQAAGLYQDGGKFNEASRLYRQFIKLYPGKYPESIEARFQLATYYKKAKQPKKQVYWLKQTIKSEKAAGRASTERTRYLAAQSTLTIAYPLMTRYRKARLVIPLKKSLKRKKFLMEKTIHAYQSAMKYHIADINTSATYHIAEIYHDFSRSLIKSQRPKGLSAEEMEQYDILLEEQAFPFEEKAIKIHSSNIRLTKNGIFDKWIKQSLNQLSELQPIRYAKFEKGEPYDEELR